MKKLLKPIGFGILYLVLYIGSSLGLSMIFSFVVAIQNISLYDPTTGDMTAYMNSIMEGVLPYTALMVILGNALAMVFIGLVFLLRKNVKLKEHIQLRKIEPMILIKTGLLGIFLNMIFVAMVTFILELFPSNNVFINQYAELMESLFSSNPIQIYLAVVIAAPLFEEFLCRGVIFNDFRKATTFWKANIIQAFVFGLIHMNLVQGVYAFLLGLVLGLVMEKYRSIWVPIILHGTYNLTSIMIDALVPDVNLMILLGIGLLGTGAVAFWMKSTYDPDKYVIPMVLEPEAEVENKEASVIVNE